MKTDIEILKYFESQTLLMGCINDGGDNRRGDKCDRGSDRYKSFYKEVSIAEKDFTNIDLESSSNIIDLYGNSDIDYEDILF